MTFKAEYIYVLGAVGYLFILGWLVLLTLKYRKIYKKGEVIFAEDDPQEIRTLINRYFKGIKKVYKENEEMSSKIKEIDKLAKKSLTKVVMARYNPFGDVGSNQSFSLAALNDRNDGFVISSIHSREGTRVYAKPIKGGESRYNLSKEEQKIINKIIKKGEKNV